MDFDNYSKMHPESSQKPSKSVNKNTKEKSLKNDSKGGPAGRVRSVSGDTHPPNPPGVLRIEKGLLSRKRSFRYPL